jgi:hypothetical protein
MRTIKNIFTTQDKKEKVTPDMVWNRILDYKSATDNLSYMNTSFMYSCLYNQTYKKSMFIFFFYVVQNNLLQLDLVNHSVTYFIWKRKYTVLRRFVQLCKWRKMKYGNHDYSLLCTPFADVKENEIIILCENSVKYKFIISELIHIINDRLTNSEDWFPEPLEIYNPFTNITFGVSNLYNIYFWIKDKTKYNMPILFYLFFLDNFVFCDFAVNHDATIRNEMIKYILRDNTKLHKYIKRMLSEYDFVTPDMNIQPSFPRDTLIKIFKPYLHFYIHSKVSMTAERRMLYNIRLKNLIVRFYEYNKKFGRKYVKRTNDGIFITNYETEHIEFITKKQYESVIDSKDMYNRLSLFEIGICGNHMSIQQWNSGNEVRNSIFDAYDEYDDSDEETSTNDTESETSTIIISHGENSGESMTENHNDNTNDTNINHMIDTSDCEIEIVEATIILSGVIDRIAAHIENNENSPVMDTECENETI